MIPITNSFKKPSRKTKEILYRLMLDSGIKKRGQWIVSETWEAIHSAETAHRKAELLQDILMTKLNEYLPVKRIKFSSDDKPWFTHQLKQLDRQRKREFYKNRKSQKWESLNIKFNESCQKSKQGYYKEIVEDLKTSNPKQWYSKVKRMSNINDDKNKEVRVESIADLPDKIQVEKIADQFSKISNEYSPLLASDINLEDSDISKPLKYIEPHQVYTNIIAMKTKSSTVINDIPMKIIKEFGIELSFPLANILNRAILYGEYPESRKVEIVTPVPKKFPPASTEELIKFQA